jgi:hypothetical protein
MSKPGYPKQESLFRYTDHYYTNGRDGSTSHGTDSYPAKILYEDKAGNNSPGYPRSIRTNGYLRSKFVWGESGLSVSGHIVRNDGYADDTVGGVWGSTFVPYKPGGGFNPWTDSYWAHDAEYNAMRQRLIAHLISNIQGSRVQLGEIYHTKHATANTVASAANRLVQAIEGLRRGNVSHAITSLTGTASKGSVSRIQRTLGGIPEQWLALRYGWLPLVQDVYNSCEVVRQAWSPQNTLFTARASAGQQLPVKELRINKVGDIGPDFLYRTSDGRMRGNASVVYSVGSDFGFSLSQLGITNPASLTWELLPYSFVADWFIPIGPFLESLDYARGLSFKHGSISIKQSQVLRRSMVNSSNSVGGGRETYSWSGGTGNGTAMVFQREALNDFPGLNLPSFKDPVSLTHVANALSLLATAFRH